MPFQSVRVESGPVNRRSYQLLPTGPSLRTLTAGDRDRNRELGRQPVGAGMEAREVEAADHEVSPVPVNEARRSVLSMEANAEESFRASITSAGYPVTEPE